MDCSPPGSSVRGISQARRLEWVAMSFSRGSSRPWDQTHVSYSAGWDGWMAPWLNKRDFEQAPGVGNGQGSLACCSPRDRKESNTTEQLNWAELNLAGGFFTTDPAQKSQCYWRMEHFSAVIFSRGKTYNFKPIKIILNPYYSYISVPLSVRLM